MRSVPRPCPLGYNVAIGWSSQVPDRPIQVTICGRCSSGPQFRRREDQRPGRGPFEIGAGPLSGPAPYFGMSALLSERAVVLAQGSLIESIWSKSPTPLRTPPPPDHCHIRAYLLL